MPSSTLLVDALETLVREGINFKFGTDVPIPKTACDWTLSKYTTKQDRARVHIAISVTGKVATTQQKIFLQNYHANHLQLQQNIDSLVLNTSTSLKDRGTFLVKQTQLQEELKKHCNDICLRARYHVYNCKNPEELKRKGFNAPKQISLGSLESHKKKFDNYSPVSA